MTRVAVVRSVPEVAGAVTELGAALGAAGVDATVVAPGAAGPRALVDAVLRRRGFTDPLAHVPLVAAALRRGAFDVAHVLTPVDALAARLWGGPVVFTCLEVLDRPRLADGRLRLRLLSDAVTTSAALTTPTEAGREALDRWLMADAQVVPLADGAGHARVYDRVCATPRERSAYGARP